MASHALGDGGIPPRDATRKGLTRVMTLSGAYGTRNYTVKGLRDQKGKRVLVETLPYSVEEAMAAEEAGIDTMKVRFDPNMPGPAADIRKAAPNTFMAFSVPLIAAASPEEAVRLGYDAMALGADAIMCQWSPRFIEAAAEAGVPVQGHAGLVPRRSTWTGGLRAVGKTLARHLLDVATHSGRARMESGRTVGPSVRCLLTKSYRRPVVFSRALRAFLAPRAPPATHLPQAQLEVLQHLPPCSGTAGGRALPAPDHRPTHPRPPGHSMREHLGAEPRQIHDSKNYQSHSLSRSTVAPRRRPRVLGLQIQTQQSPKSELTQRSDEAGRNGWAETARRPSCCARVNHARPALTQTTPSPYGRRRSNSLCSAALASVTARAASLSRLGI